MAISIIIPTLNRHELLFATLGYLKLQKINVPFEVIVVDQSIISSETLFKNKFDNIDLKYYQIHSFKSLPHARNFGWQLAKYPLIVFIDDDVEFESDFLQKHYNCLVKYPNYIIGGGITEKFKTNSGNKVGYFNKSSAAPIRGFHLNYQGVVDHIGGGNFSCSKQVLESINGFDENLETGASLYEETDFCLRAKKQGFFILFNSDIHLMHLASDTGGCRVPEVVPYFLSLATNRTVLINRNLNEFYKLTAIGYLFKLALSHAWAYKNVRVIGSFFKGLKTGKRISKLPIKCTHPNEDKYELYTL